MNDQDTEFRVLPAGDSDHISLWMDHHLNGNVIPHHLGDFANITATIQKLQSVITGAEQLMGNLVKWSNKLQLEGGEAHDLQGMPRSGRQPGVQAAAHREGVSGATGDTSAAEQLHVSAQGDAEAVHGNEGDRGRRHAGRLYGRGTGGRKP